MVLGLTFKSLSILSLFLYVEWDSGQVSFFCMWLSSFPYTTRWRDCPFFTVCFLLLCHELIGHICMGLSQGSWFCSLDLSVLLAQAYVQDLGGLVFPHSFFLNLSGHLGVMGLTVLGLTFLPCLCLNHYDTLSWPKTSFWYYGKTTMNFLANPISGPFL